MSDIAIRAEGLGKRYLIGRAQQRHTNLREALAHGVRSAASSLAPFGRRSARKGGDTIWALRDIDFQIRRGEAVGIIGGNGAGKSTLLKLLSRITEPTVGNAWIHGRVGSLLEVGTGFHPELTGRENVALNGAILGMGRREVARKFDEIVAFSGVDRFIDTPVKRYSSGMYLRLAFAVAAHLEPEILIVDEVLAVGDAAFQRKCIGKMGDVVEEGRTVLFVSHNLTAVQGLCSRALWLREGALIEDGPVEEVTTAYLRTAASSAMEHAWPDPESAPGTKEVRVLRASARPASGAPADLIDVRTEFVIEFETWNRVAGSRLSVGIRLFDELGTMIFHSSPVGMPEPREAGVYRDRCRVPGDLLNNGIHTVELRIARDREHLVYLHRDILTLDIHDSPDMREGWFMKWPGVVRPHLEWSTEPLRLTRESEAARRA